MAQENNSSGRGPSFRPDGVHAGPGGDPYRSSSGAGMTPNPFPRNVRRSEYEQDAPSSSQSMSSVDEEERARGVARVRELLSKSSPEIAMSRPVKSPADRVREVREKEEAERKKREQAESEDTVKNKNEDAYFSYSLGATLTPNAMARSSLLDRINQHAMSPERQAELRRADDMNRRQRELISSNIEKTRAQIKEIEERELRRAREQRESLEAKLKRHDEVVARKEVEHAESVRFSSDAVKKTKWDLFTYVDPRRWGHIAATKQTLAKVEASGKEELERLSLQRKELEKSLQLAAEQERRAESSVRHFLARQEADQAALDRIEQSLMTSENERLAASGDALKDMPMTAAAGQAFEPQGQVGQSPNESQSNDQVDNRGIGEPEQVVDEPALEQATSTPQSQAQVDPAMEKGASSIESQVQDAPVSTAAPAQQDAPTVDPLKAEPPSLDQEQPAIEPQVQDAPAVEHDFPQQDAPAVEPLKTEPPSLEQAPPAVEIPARDTSAVEQGAPEVEPMKGEPPSLEQASPVQADEPAQLSDEPQALDVFAQDAPAIEPAKDAPAMEQGSPRAQDVPQQDAPKADPLKADPPSLDQERDLPQQDVPAVEPLKTEPQSQEEDPQEVSNDSSSLEADLSIDHNKPSIDQQPTLQENKPSSRFSRPPVLNGEGQDDSRKAGMDPQSSKQGAQADKPLENRDPARGISNDASRPPSRFSLPPGVADGGPIKVGPFKRERDGCYKAADAGDRTSFKDNKDSIFIPDDAELEEIQGAIKLAQEKGATSFRANGTPEFCRKAFIEGAARGIKVKGYEPTQDDLLTAAKRAAEIKRSGDEIKPPKLSSDSRGNADDREARERDKPLSLRSKPLMQVLQRTH